MPPEHFARITWSDEQVRRGLPATPETIDPAWIEGAEVGHDDAWSLICHFDVPPSEQGNPSAALVWFLVAEAPHDALQAGAHLRLFERGTRGFATVEIVE